MNASHHLLAAGLALMGGAGAVRAADATLSKCSVLAMSAVHPLQQAGVNPFMNCYIGQGAGLNDHNGRERDARGDYLRGNRYCHVAWSGGFEVYVGKRPATISYPMPGRVNPKTPIVWRPVSSVRVAN